MASILDCPTELIELIAEELDVKDSKNFRLACKQIQKQTFRSFGERHLRRIVVPLTYGTLKSFVQLSKNDQWRNFIQAVTVVYDDDSYIDIFSLSYPFRAGMLATYSPYLMMHFPKPIETWQNSQKALNESSRIKHNENLTEVETQFEGFERMMECFIALMKAGREEHNENPTKGETQFEVDERMADRYNALIKEEREMMCSGLDRVLLAEGFDGLPNLDFIGLWDGREGDDIPSFDKYGLRVSKKSAGQYQLSHPIWTVFSAMRTMKQRSKIKAMSLDFWVADNTTLDKPLEILRPLPMQGLDKLSINIYLPERPWDDAPDLLYSHILACTYNIRVLCLCKIGRCCGNNWDLWPSIDGLEILSLVGVELGLNDVRKLVHYGKSLACLKLQRVESVDGPWIEVFHMIRTIPNLQDVVVYSLERPETTECCFYPTLFRDPQSVHTSRQGEDAIEAANRIRPCQFETQERMTRETELYRCLAEGGIDLVWGKPARRGIFE